MTAPALFGAVQGGGSLSADNINTLTQSCYVASQLRGYIGLVGQTVFMLGANAIGDGGQGLFYWNATSVSNDDNGVTTIEPFGVLEGRWVRIPLTSSGGLGQTALVLATQAIFQGAFVSYGIAGANSVVLASAAANSPLLPANAFAPAAIPINTVGLIQFSGTNTFTGTPSASWQTWLSATTPGGYATTRPNIGGQIVQTLGPALLGVGIPFNPGDFVLL